MIFGDSDDEESNGGNGLRNGVPTKLSIVYGKSSYDLEFTDDDFQNEATPSKGVTVLSLKFIASRILTPKILLNDTANNGLSEVDGRSSSSGGQGAKLINPSNFTLIHQGRKLLDDKKYLLDYKIRNGAKVLVMVSSPERVAAAAAAATRSSKSTASKSSNGKKPRFRSNQDGGPSSTTTPRAAPAATATARVTSSIPRSFPVKPLTPEQEIQKIMDQVDQEIGPLIAKFIQHPPEPLNVRKDEHHRISELVLQKMFMMDGIDTSGSQDVRQKRKDAINTLHQHLAKIDEVSKSGESNESNEHVNNDQS